MNLFYPPKINLINLFNDFFKNISKLDFKVFKRNQSIDEYSPQEIKEFEKWCELQ